MTPSREGCKVGWRCSHRLAFPRHKAMATLPKRCLVVVVCSSEPALTLTALPIEEMVVMVSSASPPRVSATKGTKSIPEERQAERLEVSFRWTPSCKAWPGVTEASDTVRSWSGLITWTSNAAGRPQFQLGRRISAGRDRELGNRPGVSLVGARAADWAAVKITSRMALWRETRSPLPPQPTWWSPKESALPRHSGQG